MKQGSTLLLIFVMLIMLSVGYAAEIVEREALKPVPGDLTLVKNPKRDLNGKLSALIKIYTDLAPFDKIESNLTPVEVQNRPGEVWLFLSHDERRIYFSKDGYAKLVYDIPLTLESNKVYEMKLIGSGVNVSKAFPVTIRINPEDAILKVENIQYDASKPVLLEPGTYNLEVSKSGYISESRKIIVNADKVFFEITLKSHDLQTVTIRSIPTEADISLENVAKGKTNKQDFLYPGSYRLRLSKSGFETIEENIKVVESGENVFEFTLQKSTGNLIVNLDPPDATILINNTEYKGKSFELAAGVYKVEARKSGYDTYEQQVELQKGKDTSISLKLQKSTANLIVNLDPPDATILINNTEYQGKSFELAAGAYKVEARKSGYDSIEQRVELQKGKDTSITLKLIRQSGRLLFTVEPMEASISLSDGSKWNGAKIVTLPVGEYRLNATLQGYKNLERVVKIEKDKDSALNISMEIQSAAVSSIPSPAINPVSIPEGLIYVEGGSFMMGSSDGDSDEKPVHKVSVPSFMIGKYEVTQKEWMDIMGSKPSRFNGDNRPVERVSWYATLIYCNKRSIKEGLTPVYSISGSTDPGKWGAVPKKSNSNWNAVTCNWDATGYRLPTEAEWEYAARGGNKSKGYKYSGSNDINQVAWYGSSYSKTKSVGSKAANELGIHDMSGNVWEWCWDWYDDGYYAKSPESSPKGAASGSKRVLRGGSWCNPDYGCHVANRSNNNPDFSYDSIGVRVARAIK